MFGKMWCEKASLVKRIFSFGRYTSRSVPVCARPRSSTWISVVPSFTIFVLPSASGLLIIVTPAGNDALPPV